MIKDIILIVLAIASLVLLVWLILVKVKTNRILKEHEALLDEAKTAGAEAIKEARAKTEFVANMSHEIRTPMNAICCATELLQKEELPRTLRSYVSILKSSSDSLLEMVNDILDFSKMDAGKMSLIEEQYDLHSLLEDIKNIISVRLTDKPVAFTIDVDPTLPKAMIGDEVRIKQILINLLNNAVKYTTKGEIALSISYERLSKDTIELKLKVKDTGCGIAPTEKDKLFKRFSQADISNHRYTEGTGLGLVICQQLSFMMGGSIAFDSELGKGSEFRVNLIQKVPKDADSVCIFDVSRNFALDFLIWEENPYYKNSLIHILSSLGIAAKSVDHSYELEGVLSSVKIDYIITTERHFNEVVSSINKYSPTTIPVKIVEISEPADTSFDGNFATIRRPIDIFEILSVITEKDFVNKHNAEHAGKLMTPEAKVLLVDDNRVNLKVAKALIETFDAKVVAVDSGFEAVELIRMGEKFDLIFMDHMMPGMDGIEAANRIWAIQGENRTPIIALTANAGGEVEKLFFDAGMQDFIPKPIVLKHLNFVLQKWLPKEKQIFSNAVKQGLGKEEGIHSKAFQPEWGLSKVWNDEKIYLEMLHLYKDNNESLLNKAENALSLNDALDALNELSTLAVSAGAARLPELLNEAINLGKFGEEEIFKAKLSRIKEENTILSSEIDKYLEKKEPKDDILTYMQ
ncbi:MAG: response regulator [Lachnospiraceae bacterium]|nr:response regulator [Lachnospiraceae bacterium]